MPRWVKSVAELTTYLKNKHVNVETARELCDKCHKDKPLDQFETIDGNVIVHSDGSWSFFGQCVCKECDRTLPPFFC